LIEVPSFVYVDYYPFYNRDIYKIKLCANVSIKIIYILFVIKLKPKNKFDLCNCIDFNGEIRK